MHLFVTPELTHSDQGSSVINRIEGCQRSSQSALTTFGETLDSHTKTFSSNQIRDQLQHHHHVIALPPPGALCAGKTLLIGCVSYLQREQAMWLPPIIRHCASTTPPTRAVLRCLLWLALTHHKKIFHWEQRAVLTDACERDGSSSFFLTHHVPKLAYPHSPTHLLCTLYQCLASCPIECH